MSGAHAYLPPSSALEWETCALWPAMNATYPEAEPGLESMEGTAAHWAFCERLYGRPTSEGQLAENGVGLSGEMLEGAAVYCEVVAEAYASALNVSHYHVEQRVQNDEIHAQNWGTPDTWIFGHNPTTGRAKLVVIDYKFGKEFVEVFENRQLINYTALILHELGIYTNGLGDEYVDVEFIVVQPRSHHKDGIVRRWSFVAVDLRGPLNKLRYAAEAAMIPHPKATPDPVACKHCAGRHACEALQREGYKTMSFSRMSTPVELSPEAAGLELKALQHAIKLAEARASGLASQVEHSLASGHFNPHFAMEPGRADLSWTKPDTEIIALGALVGAELAKPPKAITPTQAKGKIDPRILDMYSHRPSAGLVLTPITTLAARKVFGR